MQNIHGETQRIIKCRLLLMLLKQKHNRGREKKPRRALAKNMSLATHTADTTGEKNSRHFISGKATITSELIVVENVSPGKKKRNETNESWRRFNKKIPSANKSYRSSAGR